MDNIHSADDHLRHLVEQARLKAERDLTEKTARRKEHEKEAREIAASIFQDAADIAYEGIEAGLDRDARLQIAAALSLQAALVRGDVNE